MPLNLFLDLKVFSMADFLNQLLPRPVGLLYTVDCYPFFEGNTKEKTHTSVRFCFMPHHLFMLSYKDC